MKTTFSFSTELLKVLNISSTRLKVKNWRAAKTYLFHISYIKVWAKLFISLPFSDIRNLQVCS